MRGADVVWKGGDAGLHWLEKRIPPDLRNAMQDWVGKKVVIKGIRHAGYKSKDVQEFVSNYGWASRIVMESMELEIIAKEATERTERAVQALEEKLDAFRGVLKNDIASVKASSDRVQAEVSKMSEQYKRATDLLNSREFLTAVENAERLAKALESIHGLQGQKIGFAVFSGDQPAAT